MPAGVGLGELGLCGEGEPAEVTAGAGVPTGVTPAPGVATDPMSVVQGPSTSRLGGGTCPAPQGTDVPVNDLVPPREPSGSPLVVTWTRHRWAEVASGRATLPTKESPKFVVRRTTESTVTVTALRSNGL